MYERSFQLGFGRADLIDMETGIFPVVAATNGDASDKHILHVRGHQTADVTPMFFNHDADPTRSAGQLTNPKVSGKSTQLGGARLHMDARLPQDGDGIMPDIRRDVARGIGDGDIRAMSIRWDDHPDAPPVMRSSLPEKHYAHTKAGEGGFYEPMFFERFVTLEVSIVGVGADSAALIGRARDVGRPQHVRDFYRVLVEGDAVSQEEAMSRLFSQASHIEGLVEVETASGAFFVPKDMAMVWGASFDAVGRGLEPDLTVEAPALVNVDGSPRADLECDETAEELEELLAAKRDTQVTPESMASVGEFLGSREVAKILYADDADGVSDEEIDQRLRQRAQDMRRNDDSREEPDHEEEAVRAAETASPDEQPAPLSLESVRISVAAMTAIDREAEQRYEDRIALEERKQAYKYHGRVES